MLPPVVYHQVLQLNNIATGPFSYNYLQKPKNAPPRIVPITDYLSPDGGGTWDSCHASEWTPELAGYPATAWGEFWVGKNKLFL